MATISPQNERLLKEAVSSGRFGSEEEALAEALRLLREQGGSSEVDVPDEAWIRSFLVWSRKPRKGNPNLDDSRESIYGDRGT